MSFTLARLVFSFLIIVCISLGLALIQNRMLWGFWISRPTVAGNLGIIDALLEVSFIDLRIEGSPFIMEGRKARIVREEALCSPPSDECLEGRLLELVEEYQPVRESTPEITDKLLRVIGLRLLPTLWRPMVSSPRYRVSGRPVSGIAIHFRRGTEENLLLAYRTSEIANDRYAYAEALFRLGHDGPELLRQVHFFYEIAGIENLRLSFLWPVNGLALLIIWLLCLRVYSLRSKRRGGMAP